MMCPPKYYFLIKLHNLEEIRLSQILRLLKRYKAADGSICQHVLLVVNDRKFPARTIFFSHTKPVSSNNPRSYTIVSAPAEQAVWRSA